MRILGLDFETTGLSLETDLIIEVGAVLWDTEAHKPLLMQSDLCYREHLKLSDEITRITGITDSDLELYGLNPEAVIKKLLGNMLSADFIVAHNGKGFDKPMLEAELVRLGLIMPEAPWIDSDSDVPYPEHIGTRKLVYLCSEHGFLNPFAHRALFDVLSMLRVVSQYDFNAIVEYAKQPSVDLKIIVPAPWKDDGKGNAKAKELGFRYNGDSKTWRKTVKKNQVESVTSAASPFKVVEVI